MKKVTIYTCGASKGDPGPAGVGIRIEDNEGNIIKEVSEAIGNATNDYAEYFAVVRGFQVLIDLFGDKTKEMEIKLMLESELVNNHLKAKEQIKDVGLIGHFIEIYNLRVASFPNLSITHVNRELNKDASRLVEEVLDV